MNNESDKKYIADRRRSTIYIVAGLIVSMILIVFFFNAISDITAKMTYDATLEVKKSMLKENVDNMIFYMDECARAYKDEQPDVGEDELEKAIFDIAYRKIYSETHVDGTYMWVQKVLDYNGGDGYAVRLIHPNLSDTEGELLSTETVNPSGIKAYEVELEGVKKNGSVFLTYDFKKLDSDEVTRKITYSKLYERFDWIVCMGVNIDDLEHYHVQAMEKLENSLGLVLLGIALTWLIMLYLMMSSYKRTSGKQYERKNRELSEKLEWDAVSGANSRIYGEKLLKYEYEQSKLGSETMIAMLDVDYFKQFNDNYGHDMGDKVLREFVNGVRHVLREGDSIIRWGGDEFVAVLHNVDRAVAPLLGDRIVNAVRAISVPGIGDSGTVTSSVGLAFFEPEDDSVKCILDRADKAVYEAKEAGRDNFKGPA